jgi:hypothetical protein
VGDNGEKNSDGIIAPALIITLALQPLVNFLTVSVNTIAHARSSVEKASKLYLNHY